MKKNIRLFLCLASSISQVWGNTPSYTVSQSHKNKVAATITGTIRKERLKYVAEIVTVGSLVIGTQSFILPDYFKRGINPTFGIANPEGTLVRGCVNFVLGQAQALSLNYFLNKLKQHCFNCVKPGRWKFTLDDFLRGYTTLYENFKHVQAEARGLLYQDDEKTKSLLLEALELKVEVLAEQLCYVDGYSINMIASSENKSKFVAKARISKEYQVFEQVRNNFITTICTRINDLKQDLQSEKFHDKVLEMINTIQQGSHDLNQRINSLNLYS